MSAVEAIAVCRQVHSLAAVARCALRTLAVLQLHCTSHEGDIQTKFLELADRRVRLVVQLGLLIILVLRARQLFPERQYSSRAGVSC